MSELHDALQALIDGRSLSDAEAELAIGEVMDGGAPDAVVGAFLVALKIKGAEADELAGAVRAMLKRARVRSIFATASVLDTCGTGGDGASTFNISTGAALIAAAAGVPVAKHGNRAISGTVGTRRRARSDGREDRLRSGRAETMPRRSGMLPSSSRQRIIPRSRRLAPLRRELRIRTIFNLMGSLGNPGASALPSAGRRRGEFDQADGERAQGAGNASARWSCTAATESTKSQSAARPELRNCATAS